MNFQMSKLDLEKAEEPGQHPLGHQKNKRIPDKQQQTVENPLKKMGMSEKLTCLLRNLCAGQEATVRNGKGTTDWFQIGKGVHQDSILSPCLFNLYAEYTMQNARLGEA